MLRLSRDQAIVLGSLLAVTVLAWLYLIDMARGMSVSAVSGMAGMAMPAEAIVMSPMSGSFAVAAAMWAVMMVGMMLPGAMPMILLFTAVQRNQGSRPVLASVVFAAGYVLLWGAFAIAAAALQIRLQHASLLSPALALTDARVSGVAFLLAGAFEFSPLKTRCLAQCRSPFTFVMQHWRSGLGGALDMGARHGLYCLGCCWVLMLLLFAAGVMNLVWVAALAVLVLLQKALPGGRLATAVTGAGMLAAGCWILLAR